MTQPRPPFHIPPSPPPPNLASMARGELAAVRFVVTLAVPFVVGYYWPVAGVAAGVPCAYLLITRSYTAIRRFVRGNSHT